MLTAAHIDQHLSRVAGLLTAYRDLLEQRTWDGIPGEALERRSWSESLLGLSDRELTQLEEQGAEGSAMSALPRSLQLLGNLTREACAVGQFFSTSISCVRPQHVKQRKAEQISAFCRILESVLPHTERVIDVGSGHGHLTREIAAILPKPVLGLERSRSLTERASTLSKLENLTFQTVDVLGVELEIKPRDCLVGLHACGELGDRVTQYAAKHGASLALVGCCLQKQRAATRTPLWPPLEALSLPQTVLGLSNLSLRAHGVEASRADNLAARERRLALYWLLREHAGPLNFGAELEGLNRRSAHAELGVLVELAFAARTLRCPSQQEILDSAARAKHVHGRARRLALPRTFLARVLELFVLLDRARFLCAHDFEVQLGELWPAQVSPRNLLLLGTTART